MTNISYAAVAARELARINGQFGHQIKSEDPGVALGAAPTPPVPAYETFADVLRAEGVDPGNLVDVFPATRSESRRKLMAVRPDPAGPRVVHINHKVAPDSEPGKYVDVNGTSDGGPIIVRIDSGIPRLQVTRGKAIIFADSTWGNSVHVAAGAEAVVFGHPGVKITVSVEEGGELSAICPEAENRFFAYGRGTIEKHFGPEAAGPAERACDECGEVVDESDEHCMDCKCSCGESLNDGEGWDGKCGTCADREEEDDDDDDDSSGQVFAMDLEDADGEPLDFSVNMLEPGQYEVESGLGDPLVEFSYVGDEQDHSNIQDAALEALKEAGHEVVDPREAALKAFMDQQRQAEAEAEANDPEPSF